MYSLAKVSYYLKKKDNYSKTAKYGKTDFSLTSTGTSQSHDAKENFVFSNMCTFTTLSVEFGKY